LAASLSSRGILSPLRVIQAPDHDGYLIVAGERRWRASALAGITDLPCLVLSGDSKDGTLQELAILDNLHRANLRPGEEARAIAKLEQYGFSQSEIAVRLGKSQGWVSQRLAMARLPEVALEQLDDGLITREEALLLAKLADHPELIHACLEPNGKQLANRLGGHVSAMLGERVQAARRFLERERERLVWTTSAQADGHRVLDVPVGEGDRRYSRLLPGSEAARVHQEVRLRCEVWAWEHGRPVRYCDKPTELKRAMLDIARLDPAAKAREDERRLLLEREGARDATLRAWLAITTYLETDELAMLLEPWRHCTPPYADRSRLTPLITATACSVANSLN
jgi:ParB/RepB/Spo0J family partition protein